MTTSSSKPRATFWSQATEAVTFYRCTLPARFLPGKVVSLCEADARVADDGETILFPRQEGAAIWSFAGNTTRALLMVGMQHQGIPVFLESDDNYLTSPPFNEISGWKKDRRDLVVKEFDLHNYQTFADIARFSDGMIVSTPKLAEIYAPLNPNVHVCPNSIDPNDWDSDPLHQKDGILRVGWAASDSHRYDARLIADALHWASSQKDVEVVVMGIHPDVSRFRFPYRHEPWADSLEDYRRRLQMFDVMLCPIIPSEWSDAKSDVKAVEAAMAGACSIVGETEPYRPWFDQPAYVAKHPWSWKKILRHLVRNRDEVRETARLAREYVLSERDIRQHVDKWRDAIKAPVWARRAA